MGLIYLAVGSWLVGGLTPLLPADAEVSARSLLANLTSWIMTLNVGSQEVSGYNHTTNPLNRSIFINGNLARVLLGSYRLTGNTTHLKEALRWCESFAAEQVIIQTAAETDGGFWGVGYPITEPLRNGSLYLGDTGSAVTALTLCARLSGEPAQRQRFLVALRRYDHFVRGGCVEAGCGTLSRGARASSGFINASSGGAIGCGYYLGHLSTCPYIIATATTGAAFYSEFASLLRNTSQEAAATAAEEVVDGALTFMASLVSPLNGSLPYTIDCRTPDWHSWPLDVVSYVTEGVVAAWLHSPVRRAALISAFQPTVEWLLRTQNLDGSWGSAADLPDQQRSPRVTSLLVLHYMAAQAAGAPPDPRLRASLVRYIAFLMSSGRTYGLEDVLNTSGFTGLAILDMLMFGSTFSPRVKEPLAVPFPSFVGTYHSPTGTVQDGHDTSAFSVGSWGIVAVINAPSDGATSFQDQVVSQCQRGVNQLFGMLIAHSEGGVFNNTNDTDMWTPLPLRSTATSGSAGMLQGAARFSALSKICPQASMGHGGYGCTPDRIVKSPRITSHRLTSPATPPISSLIMPSGGWRGHRRLLDQLSPCAPTCATGKVRGMPHFAPLSIRQLLGRVLLLQVASSGALHASKGHLATPPMLSLPWQ
jgi:hypothetical protein